MSSRDIITVALFWSISGNCKQLGTVEYNIYLHEIGLSKTLCAKLDEIKDANYLPRCVFPPHNLIPWSPRA